jgi:hypothetical protein
VPIVLKSWRLNLLEPSGPVKACNGIALPIPLLMARMEQNIHENRVLVGKSKKIEHLKSLVVDGMIKLKLILKK